MFGRRKPSVTKCVNYEIVTNRRIIPSFFSEIEIDLPGNSFEKNELIIEISGKFAFEMYFGDMVVSGVDSSELDTDSDNIFLNTWTHIDRYFTLSPVGTKKSVVHCKIQKANPYTYKIKVRSNGKCNRLKLKLHLYSNAVDVHDLAFNRKALIKDFVRVDYSKAGGRRKNCNFSQRLGTMEQKNLEKKRIKFGNTPSNEYGRLRLVHTKQYITLKALSEFKHPHLLTKAKSKRIVVTYVGPDDLTNMQTALQYLKQICKQKGINERTLYVRADMVNENTSDAKLANIVKDFTGRSTDLERIRKHESEWVESDIIIDTCTMNYWRFSKDWKDIEQQKTNLYFEEISRRINYLKPGGILYLVFPSFVSGFGKIFDDKYHSIKDDTDISTFRDTDDVIKELNSICEEIKKRYTNIIIESPKNYDSDGGSIVIRHKGDSYSSGDTTTKYQDQRIVPITPKSDTNIWKSYFPSLSIMGEPPAAFGGLSPFKKFIPRESKSKFRIILPKHSLSTIKVDEEGFISTFTEDFIQQFVDKKQSRIELIEMDDLIPYLIRKGITHKEMVAYVGLTGRNDERELIASIVEPIPIIREWRNDMGELSHYEIQSESILIEQYDFDLGDRELLRAAAAA